MQTAQHTDHSSAGIATAGQAALEALRAENRAAAARLRACHELYATCWQEQDDRDAAYLCGMDGAEQPPDHAVLDPFHVACAELVAAYGVHHHRAAAMLNLATDLVTRFPAIIEAMEAGRLDERTACMLARQMRTVDSLYRLDVQRAVVKWLMETIDSGARPGRQAILTETDRIIGEHDPEGVLIRRQHALRERNVSIRRGIDGMADLQAHLSTPEAQAIYDALQKAASQAQDRAAEARDRALHARGMGPGLNEYRADALVDALLGPASDRTVPPSGTGSGPPRVRPNITVLMPLTPLGEPEVYLPRGGPASIEALISLLSRSVGATITVANPEPGAADTDKGARRYRIGAELARRIRQRDGACRHPGCSVSADDCDVDHVRPFSHTDPGSGGLTVESNLMCLCRNHHRFKTFYGWHYHLSRDGTLTITTDTGHIITTEPTGPLALWRRLEAYGSASPRARSEQHDGPEDEHVPGTRPWMSPTARSTHWYRRTQRLEAERRANAVRKEDEAARLSEKNRERDSDPPPF